MQPHCCKSPPPPIAEHCKYSTHCNCTPLLQIPTSTHGTALQILHPWHSIVALLQTPATHCTACQVPANWWREAGWFKCTSTSTYSLIQVQVQKCKPPPIAQHGKFQQTGGERLEVKPWLVPRSLCTPTSPPPSTGDMPHGRYTIHVIQKCVSLHPFFFFFPPVICPMEDKLTIQGRA